MKNDHPFEFDCSAFSVVSREEHEKEEETYWHSKTPEERLAAMELMRQINYDYDSTSDRLPHVFEVVERA